MECLVDCNHYPSVGTNQFDNDEYFPDNSVDDDFEIALAMQMDENPSFFEPIIKHPIHDENYMDDYFEDQKKPEFTDHQIIEEQNLEFKESLKEDEIREKKKKREDFLIERAFNIRKNYRLKLYEKYKEQNIKNNFTVMLKLPNQERIKYRFHEEDTIQNIYEFVAGQMAEFPLLKIENFVLELPYPKVCLDDQSLKLKESILKPNSVIIVRENTNK